MLGVILTSDANSEQARTDISRESTLSNCLDSYKLDDDIIKSEIYESKISLSFNRTVAGNSKDFSPT